MISPSTTRALANATVASDTSHAGSAGAAAATARKAKAPRRIARDPMSDLPRLHWREQSVGPEGEHQGHHAVAYEQLDLRNEVNGIGPAEADDEDGNQRAADRYHPADGDDGKGEHDHLV